MPSDGSRVTPAATALPQGKPSATTRTHSQDESDGPTELVVKTPDPWILEAASRLLASKPFNEVTLELVAQEACIPMDDVALASLTMREIAIAILVEEGSSMRHAQRMAAKQTSHPIEVLRLTFEYVGKSIATESVVRAGIRIAAESRACFPERRIDPFRTWRSFIYSQLSHAETMGLLKPNVDLHSITWLLVSAGLGSKELVSFRDAWEEIEDRLASVLGLVLNLILLDRQAS